MSVFSRICSDQLAEVDIFSGASFAHIAKAKRRML
jgi:hypothetical protein